MSLHYHLTFPYPLCASYDVTKNKIKIVILPDFHWHERPHFLTRCSSRCLRPRPPDARLRTRSRNRKSRTSCWWRPTGGGRRHFRSTRRTRCPNDCRCLRSKGMGLWTNACFLLFRLINQLFILILTLKSEVLKRHQECP